MDATTRSILRKLGFSALFLLAILILQPIEIFFLAKKIPVLFPKGIVALKERNLLFFIQALMLLVIIPVYIFTFIFSWRYRAGNDRSTYDPHLVDSVLAEIVWWGLPTLMVLIVSVVVWQKTYELDPYKPIEPVEKTLTVQAVALEWKWLFLYPEEKIAVVNELRIPKERPMRFLITADAPMNTFWIPRLAGQIYAMPGMQTQLHLIANEAGEFRGSSGHISGEGFSKMHFLTKVTSEEEYDSWVTEVKSGSKLLTSEVYEQLVEPTIGHSVQFYRLEDADLFRKIIMKYMMPPITSEGEKDVRSTHS